MVGAGEREGGFLGERSARLVDPPPAGGHQTGEDQRLGFRPAFGEPLVDEKLIGAPLRHRFVLAGAPFARRARGRLVHGALVDVLEGRHHATG